MLSGSVDRLVAPIIGVMFVGGAIVWVFLNPALHLGSPSPPDWLTLGAGAVLAYYFGRGTQQATSDQLTNGINTTIQKAQAAVRAPSRATDTPSSAAAPTAE